MKIFLDLDGTLLDNRNRVFGLFEKLAPDICITESQYWSLKRSGSSNLDLFQAVPRLDDELSMFEEAWAQAIETPVLLALDQLFDGVLEYLHRSQDKATLFLCTMRRQRVALLQQLRELGLLEYFEGVLSPASHLETKQSLMLPYCDDVTRSWVVGDTTEDIRAGQSLGMRTCAVTSGACSAESIRLASPDLILESVTSFRF